MTYEAFTFVALFSSSNYDPTWYLYEYRHIVIFDVYETVFFFSFFFTLLYAAARVLVSCASWRVLPAQQRLAPAESNSQGSFLTPRRGFARKRSAGWWLCCALC